MSEVWGMTVAQRMRENEAVMNRFRKLEAQLVGQQSRFPPRGRASDTSPTSEPTREPYLNPILLTRLRNGEKLWIGLSEPVENSLVADSLRLKKNGYADITSHLKARLREDSSGNLVLELFPS